MTRSVDACHYHFPSCLAIACPWNYSPKAVSLKEAVKGVANDSLSQGGVAHNSVCPGSHYPNQPWFFQRAPLSANILTYCGGATICPPQMQNDVALAETLVIAMRIAAMRELKLNGESETPTLQTVLELRRKENGSCIGIDTACQYKTVPDGLADDNSVNAVARKSYAKVQTGKEVPLCSTSGYILPEHPWPKTAEVADKDTAFCLYEEEEILLQARSRQ